ncbi:uncharacterized protein B0T15DRAFT_560268 [Chaetomium strumarium]|uniref:Uncharacterized protein n=1 Tax=Chaetomium strumarium TaxID=1170767 RepID=A0AAJ0GNN3_9PEZI|nr:hypothetical protein B0T15DRAFT_560268 [Chaetomium strumarium]
MRYYATNCTYQNERTLALQIPQLLAKIARDPDPNARDASRSYDRIMEEAKVARDVLGVAIKFQEYPLLRNVLNWVDASSVSNETLSLVRLATTSGTLEFGEIKESLLQHFSKRSLQLNVLCLSALWPLKEAPHPEIEALVVNGASIPLTTPRYHQLILAILETYIDRYVGPEPPAEINWTVPGVNCNSYNCTSSDCSELDAFLRSSTQSVARVQIGKKRRQHLHQLLDRARSPCTHTTDRSTYPETLVVTKVVGKGLARNGWEARVKKAREVLEGFGSDLGTSLKEDYDRIMRMVAPAD